MTDVWTVEDETGELCFAAPTEEEALAYVLETWGIEDTSVGLTEVVRWVDGERTRGESGKDFLWRHRVDASLRYDARVVRIVIDEDPPYLDVKSGLLGSPLQGEEEKWVRLHRDWKRTPPIVLNKKEEAVLGAGVSMTKPQETHWLARAGESDDADCKPPG